jgi:hypothetical protein
MKKCGRCKQTKELTEFTVAHNRKDGVQHWCRACQRDYDANTPRGQAAALRRAEAQSFRNSQKLRGVKTCSHCKQEKPVAEFYSKVRTASGYSSRCKSCDVALAIDLRNNNYERYHAREVSRQARRRLTLPFRFSQCRAGAKARDIVFDLTFEQYCEIVANPCAYGAEGAISDVVMGVDRKDSILGYVVENCVACCSFHNYIKSAFLDYSQFRAAMDCKQTLCSDDHPLKQAHKLKNSGRTK